jgi:hypothetical protein
MVRNARVVPPTSAVVVVTPSISRRRIGTVDRPVGRRGE